jgi:hypothetical protein
MEGRNYHFTILKCRVFGCFPRPDVANVLSELGQRGERRQGRDGSINAIRAFTIFCEVCRLNISDESGSLTVALPSMIHKNDQKHAATKRAPEGISPAGNIRPAKSSGFAF